MQRAKFVEEITVKDPDTGSLIELEVYKHEGGGMFAIDSSFADQVAEDILEDGRTIIVDPFYSVYELKDESQYLILEE
jgi:hypothetical protein